eukprot:TRINITY_DN7725_c0_g1_i1.p1 TRINITY_DN7725_c0_g1~~TRINITY_DN7725_c0_g1_i1.p1  ORF type:complete len:1043 (-),score=33.77 TRINITY_DN7725_c0_g1_i1:264-3317(-)
MKKRKNAAENQQEIAFYNWTPEQVAEHFGTSVQDGLLVERVEEVRQKYGRNVLVDNSEIKIPKILWRHFNNLMTYVLIAALVLSAAVQEFIDVVIIGVIVVLNVLIGFSQDYSSEKTMASLKNMTAPTCTVVRGGQEMDVPAPDIVPGDLVIVQQGGIVPCDVRLVEAVSLECNEALLTGESLPAEKSIQALTEPHAPLGDRTNMAFSGTAVSKGRGLGIVVAIGMNTQIGKIAESIGQKKDEKSKLAKRLEKLAIVLTICAVLTIGLVLLAVYLYGTTSVYPHGLEFGISVAIAIIPEGLTPVLTLTLTVGVRMMVKKGAIIRKISAIEIMGNVTDICSDKTGTLTEGRMVATCAWIPNTLYNITGGIIAPFGKLVSEEGQEVNKLDGSLRMAMVVCSLCNTAGLRHKSDAKLSVELPSPRPSVELPSPRTSIESPQRPPTPDEGPGSVASPTTLVNDASGDNVGEKPQYSGYVFSDDEPARPPKAAIPKALRRLRLTYRESDYTLDRELNASLERYYLTHSMEVPDASALPKPSIELDFRPDSAWRWESYYPEYEDEDEEEAVSLPTPVSPPANIDDSIPPNVPQGPHLLSVQVQYPEGDAEQNWTATGSPTEIALLVLAWKVGLEPRTLRDTWQLLNEYPFDSTVKRMSRIFLWKQDGCKYLLAKGAPEGIMSRATKIITETGDRALTEEDRAKIEEVNDSMAKEGLRALCLAFRKLPDSYSADQPRDGVETELIFVGLIGISDPPRASVPDSVAIAQKAGIVVRMLTGDHPSTAAAIARQVGILKDNQSHRVMVAKAFDDAPDEDFKELSDLPLVVARCSPESKVKMVRLLKSMGRTCAMTGDGVNDAPAISSADVGVAMGQAGSDVTKEAASLVLVDDNFSTIVTAVAEGRRIFSNIRKFIIYQLTSNVAQVTSILLLVAAGLPTPLTAVQLLITNMITGTAPAMAMSLEPAAANIMDKRYRKPTEALYTGEAVADMLFYGLVMGGLLIAAFLLNFYVFGASLEQYVSNSFG